jgi:hypothetical protein
MVIMRGSSKPAAKTEILNPGGKAIDLSGSSGSGCAASLSGIAVAAGGSGNRLGLPIVKVHEHIRMAIGIRSKRFISMLNNRQVICRYPCLMKAREKVCDI